MIVQADTFEKDKAWIEMIHRYIAGSLGLLVFALTLTAFFKKNSVLQNVRHLLGFTSLLIIFQALLGMWTVTKLLHPTIVMLHLLGGMATLSMIWFIHLRLQNPPALQAAPFLKGAKVASRIGLIVVVLQIALGGWVSTNYAAFACPDFPTCQAQWWPPLNFEAFNIFIPIDRNFDGGFLNHPERVTIHFIHRLGALVTALYLIGMSVYLLHLKVISKKLIFGLLIVLTIQITLGILNVMLHVPLWAAVLHNGIAAILLLYMVTIYESVA
jgi:cytochrome c oxidase assembly protein subunit 15